MTSDRQQVDLEFVDVGRDLASRLLCIGVKTDAMLPPDLADLLDRLDGAASLLACIMLRRVV